MGFERKSVSWPTDRISLNEGSDEKDGPEYKAFFQKMLKKFGVDQPDKLEGAKKKEFYDAVDKGWKGDAESD
jgi:hypothetical protein